MISDVGYADPTGMMIVPVVVLVIFFILALVCLSIFEPSKTKKYRRTVVDLYIAGKVRQLAEADKIDLDVEASRYKTWKKKQRLEYRALDDTIESEVQDKITDKATDVKKQS